MHILKLSILLIMVTLLFVSCGGDEAEPESEASTETDTGINRAKQFDEAIDSIIAILERRDSKAIYDDFVKPSALEKISASPGGLDSAYIKFNVFIPPLLEVLNKVKDEPPQYNEDTTYAVYDVAGAPAPVNFQYLDGRWYFSPKD